MECSTSEPPKQLYKQVFIQPTYVVIKPVYSGMRKKLSIKQRENTKNLRDNKHRGKISRKAISNLKNSVNWLLAASQPKRVWVRRERKSFYFKINFITLTIPPQSLELVDYRTFQRCLNTWLTYARKYFYLHNYVWKVELHQDKRLHIHITTDTFIHYQKLRDSWNRILQRNNLLNDHYNKFGNFNPNSTDVHAVYKVRNIGAYIGKYMSKESGLAENYRGRIWGCSSSLSCKNKCEYNGDIYWSSEDYSFLNSDNVRTKEIRTNPDSMGLTKHLAIVALMNINEWDRMIDCMTKRAYMSKIIKIRAGTPDIPREYLEIDFFKSKSEGSYNNNYICKTDNQQCINDTNTPKIGTTLFDLEY